MHAGEGSGMVSWGIWNNIRRRGDVLYGSAMALLQQWRLAQSHLTPPRGIHMHDDKKEIR